jgi:hypothetical protein
MSKLIYRDYEFDGNSDISGVTAVHITQDATLDDQAVRLGQIQTLVVGAASSDLLDITGDELTVKALLITDTTVDSTGTTIAAFAAANYTGSEFQEGDVVVLAAATDAEDRTWIHNGGTANDENDFTRVSSTVDNAFVRAAISGGDGIDYNSTTGEIESDVDDTTIELSASDGSGVLRVKADGINDTHIDFGTGANQVSAVDMPIADTGANFTATEVEGALAELATLAATTEDLGATLAVGNTTEGNDIVMTSGDVISSSSGDSFLDLRYASTDNQIVLANDAGLAKANLLLSDTFLQTSFGTDFYQEIKSGEILLHGTASYYAADNSEAGFRQSSAYSAGHTFIIAPNATENRSIQRGDDAVMINSGEGSASLFLSGVTNTVIVGGAGITAKTNDTAYVNQVSFQEDGVTFDTLVVPSTATADRTQILQDKSGTIALVTDISDKEYDETVALVANVAKEITHSLASNKIHIQLWDSNGAIPDVDIIRTSTNTIELTSNTSLSDIEVYIYKHS